MVSDLVDLWEVMLVAEMVLKWGYELDVRWVVL